MSRPQKTGLDYFPVVTEWDQKLRLVKAKYKLLGVGCILELWRAVYREGYALTWTEDAELLFADENSIDLETLREIVRFAVDRGIFSREKLDEAHVLTSHGIQMQWLGVALESHRKNTVIDPHICLLADEELLGDKVPRESSGGGVSTGGNTAGAGFPPGEMPQSKAKQSKVNSEERCAREGPPVDNSERASLDAYLQLRLSKAKKVGDPESWLSKMRVQDDVIAAWRTWEAGEEKRKPLPSPPPCDCESEGDLLDYAMGPGGIRKLPRNKRVCAQCGKLWEYDDDFGQWGPASPALDDFEKTG